MKKTKRTPTETALLNAIDGAIEALRPFGCESDMTLEQWSDIIWNLIAASCKAHGLPMPTDLDDWPHFAEVNGHRIVSSKRSKP
jgi:hypothetical protein